MQCPKCALYHPSRYERCVSCGSNLVTDNEAAKQAPPVSTKHSRGVTHQRETESGRHGQDYDRSSGTEGGDGQYGNMLGGGYTFGHQHAAGNDLDERQQGPAGRGAGQEFPKKKGGLPVALGIAIAGFILCASAGVTYFFLTKPPENERLLVDGQRQLTLGQYAFALKTLTEAQHARPNDPRVLLALARAYVGVDQVDKAWDCITQAQSLGAGVIADPALATDLANYYRQHNQYERAIELLRPLAQQNTPGKKAELADLDAAWGDECMRNGDLKQALTAWEEVKDTHDGSRYTEADTRLSSIYQKMGEQMAMKGDVDEALKYYNKLNSLVPSAYTYERAAELYQKQGNLELAIDQMNQAIKQGGDPSTLNRKLAGMMTARGKELIDKGDVDTGYGFLQKAQSLDTHIHVPTATVRGAQVSIDSATGLVHFNGSVWNPGPAELGSVTVRGELYDTKDAKSLWEKDQKIIDEFVPPLAVHDSKAFELTSGVPPINAATTDFRVYLNGMLYKSYPLTKDRKPSGGDGDTGSVLSSIRPRAGQKNGGGADSGLQLAPRIQPPTQGNNGNPPLAPNTVNGDITTTPPLAPSPGSGPGTTAPTPNTGPSPEEKTLNDLN